MRKQGNWLKFRTSELGLWPDLLGSFHPLLPEGVEFGWEAMIQKEQGGKNRGVRCRVICGPSQSKVATGSCCP